MSEKSSFLGFNRETRSRFCGASRRVSFAACAAVFLCASLVAYMALFAPYVFDVHNSRTIHSIFALPTPQASSTSLDTEGAPRPEVCHTQACKDFSRTIMESLSKNYSEIDPCSDFASYVRGGWYETHEIPPNKSAVSVFSLLRDKNVEFLRDLLEQGYPGDSRYIGNDAIANLENFRMMQSAYNACVGMDSIEALGAEPLNNLLGQLPEAERYQSVSGLTNTLIWLKRLGVDALINVYPRENDIQPDVMTIFVSGGSFTLPSKDYYNKSDIVGNYTDTISEVFQTILQINERMADDLARRVAALETRIANLQPYFTDRENDVASYYNPTSFFELNDLVPQISLVGLISAFTPVGYSPDELVLTAPKYFAELPAILQDTSPETLQAYFQWLIIHRWGLKVDGHHNADLRRLKNLLAGRPLESTKERWETCVGEIDDYLGWIDSSFYIQLKYDNMTNLLMNAMVEELKSIYHERVDTYDWMSAEVKKKVRQKIDLMGASIGFPRSPNVRDPQAIRDYYRSLSLSNTSYFENTLALNTFLLEKEWQRLLHPGDKDSWIMTVPTINAYYKPTTNSIYIAGGILQSPFFSLDLPAYVSYGGIGAFTGHEMTHAFDATGSLYDASGVYTTWWDARTRAAFSNKTRCFISQYANYTVPLESSSSSSPSTTLAPIDGALTLNENIADAGGLSAAYAAWARRHARAPDPLLPGLPPALARDPRRLFFVSFAAKWCRRARAEERARGLRDDPHATGIVGAVANVRAFG